MGLEDYTVLRELGKGGFGRTYLAQRTDGTQVCLKKLRFGDEGENDAFRTWELFEREVKTLQALDHPAIPKCLDFFKQDGLNYLVMEFKEGKNLRDAVKERHFSENEVKDIGAKVCEVLEYLHSRTPPVIHRDIKPANLILQPDNNVAVVDFGSVADSVLRGSGNTHTSVGTYGFAALEAMYGKASTASDIYSLGAVMIYLIGGGAEPAALMNDEHRIDFTGKFSMSTSLENLLLEMTKPSLAKRIATAAEVHKRLLTLSEPTPSPLTNAKARFETIYQIFDTETRLSLNVAVDICEAYVWNIRKTGKKFGTTFSIVSQRLVGMEVQSTLETDSAETIRELLSRKDISLSVRELSYSLKSEDGKFTAHLKLEPHSWSEMRDSSETDYGGRPIQKEFPCNGVRTSLRMEPSNLTADDIPLFSSFVSMAKFDSCKKRAMTTLIPLQKLGIEDTFDIICSPKYAFATGSQVNGFAIPGSDYDIVVVSNDPYDKKTIKEGDIAATVVPYQLAKSTRPSFLSQHIVPLLNEEAARKDEYEVKSMVVKEQLKETIEPLSPLEIATRHFAHEWTVDRPQRSNHFDRWLASKETQALIEQDYTVVCEKMAAQNELIACDGKYLLPPPLLSAPSFLSRIFGFLNSRNSANRSM